MARFVKLTFGDGTHGHINAEHVTHFYSEAEKTVIRFDAPWLDESDCVRVKESLDEVAGLLSGEGSDLEPPMAWEYKYVEDREHDPMGLFRRRWYCPKCGNWTSFGVTPYCPWCGKPLLPPKQSEEEAQDD